MLLHTYCSVRNYTRYFSYIISFNSHINPKGKYSYSHFIGDETEAREIGLTLHTCISVLLLHKSVRAKMQILSVGIQASKV